MTVEERMERLERIVADLCSNVGLYVSQPRKAKDAVTDNLATLFAELNPPTDFAQQESINA